MTVTTRAQIIRDVESLLEYVRGLPDVPLPTQLRGVAHWLDEEVDEARPESEATYGGPCTCERDAPGLCACASCAYVARMTDACGRRAQGGRAGLYRGMCGPCFQAAREISACGSRVAEHDHGHAPEEETD